MKSIYITLDSIIDTRYKILSGLNREIVKDHKSYFNRKSMSMPSISDRVFSRLYAKRDLATLSSPMFTPIVDIVRTYIGEKRKLMNMNGVNKDVIVTLNVYPYNIEGEDAVVLKRYIMGMLGSLCEVDVVNLPHISISFASIHYDTMILFDGLDWLDKNLTEDGFNKGLYGTAIITSPGAKGSVRGSDYEFLVDMCSPLFQLEVLSYSVFSCVK